jgi:hypothetical protein
VSITNLNKKYGLYRYIVYCVKIIKIPKLINNFSFGQNLEIVEFYLYKHSQIKLEFTKIRVDDCFYRQADKKI